jgi:hypothetical protein
MLICTLIAIPMGWIVIGDEAGTLYLIPVGALIAAPIGAAAGFLSHRWVWRTFGPY